MLLAKPLDFFTRSTAPVRNVAYQILLADRHGKQMLSDLIVDDPDMADLAIGVLMRYDP